MQVGSAQPEPVKREVGIAKRLLKRLELIWRALENFGHLEVAQAFRVRVEPVRVDSEVLVGFDFGVVIEFDLSEFLALENIALDILISVAAYAIMLHVSVASPRDCRRIRPIGARKRL